MRIEMTPTEEYLETRRGLSVHVWAGTTDSGIAVRVFVAAVTAQYPDDNDELQTGLVDLWVAAAKLG